MYCQQKGMLCVIYNTLWCVVKKQHQRSTFNGFGSFTSAWVHKIIKPKEWYINLRDIYFGRYVVLGNISYIETKAWPDKNFDKNVVQLAGKENGLFR